MNEEHEELISFHGFQLKNLWVFLDSWYFFEKIWKRSFFYYFVKAGGKFNKKKSLLILIDHFIRQIYGSRKERQQKMHGRTFRENQHLIDVLLLTPTFRSENMNEFSFTFQWMHFNGCISTAQFNIYFYKSFIFYRKMRNN